MKILLKISLLFAFIAMTATNIDAQKFGHLNTSDILTLMPGVDESDTALKAYQDSLVAVGEAKAAALRSEFEAFSKAYNDGDVPPIKAQEKQAEFQKRQEELQQYEQLIYNLVNQKRQELLQPLIVQLHDAIQAVGKEGGYTMIFETGASAIGFSALLYTPESDDVTALVKAKLNIE